MQVDYNGHNQLVLGIETSETNIIQYVKQKKMFWMKWSVVRDNTSSKVPDMINVYSHKTGKSMAFYINSHYKKISANDNHYWTYKCKKGRVKHKDLKIWLFDDYNQDFDLASGY